MQVTSQSHENFIHQLGAFQQESMRLEKDKRQKASIDELMQSVPSLYRGKTFDDFKIDHPGQSRIKNIAERYVETYQDRFKNGDNLIFTGASGTGKTLLAFIIYQSLAKAGVRVRYKSSLAFLREIHEKNFESSASFEKILNDYNSFPFLIIDEVTEGFAGKGGTLSDWEKKMLFTLIDRRYSECLSTLVISNRSLDEMAERLGVTTYGRLSEKGISMKFNWKSYRIKNKELSNAKT